MKGAKIGCYVRAFSGIKLSPACTDSARRMTVLFRAEEMDRVIFRENSRRKDCANEKLIC